MGLFVLYLFVCLFVLRFLLCFWAICQLILSYSRLKRLDPQSWLLQWIALYKVCRKNWTVRALSFQPIIPEMSGRNQMERTILVRSDRNICDYHWSWSTFTGPLITEMSQLLSPVPLFCIPAYKNKNIAKREVVCAAGMYLSIRHVEFPKFQTGLFVECNGPRMSSSSESF